MFGAFIQQTPPAAPFGLSLKLMTTKTQALDAIDSVLFAVAEATATNLDTENMEETKKQLVIIHDVMEKLHKMRMMVATGRDEYRNTW